MYILKSNLTLFNESLIQHGVSVVDILPLYLHLSVPLILTLFHHVYHVSDTQTPAPVGPHEGVIHQVIFFIVCVLLIGGRRICLPSSQPTTQIQFHHQAEHHVDNEDNHHPQYDYHNHFDDGYRTCLLSTSPSPRDS